MLCRRMMVLILACAIAASLSPAPVTADAVGTDYLLTVSGDACRELRGPVAVSLRMAAADAEPEFEDGEDDDETEHSGLGRPAPSCRQLHRLCVIDILDDDRSLLWTGAEMPSRGPPASPSQ